MESLIVFAKSFQSGRNDLIDWFQHEFGIEKPTQKLADVASLNADEMIAEVKKIRGRKSPLSVQDVKRLKSEHATSVVPLQAFAQEASRLESRVSDLVNAAYGLTPDEIALLWQTAPPRMPISQPAAQSS